MGLEIGTRLVELGIVTRLQLAESLAQPAVLTGGGLIKHLVSTGVSEQTIVQFFAKEGYTPIVTRTEVEESDARWVERISADMARNLRVIPLREKGGKVVVAMSDPSDRHAVRDLEFSLGRKIIPRVTFERDIAWGLERWFSSGQADFDRPKSNPAPASARLLTPTTTQLSTDFSRSQPKTATYGVRPEPKAEQQKPEQHKFEQKSPWDPNEGDSVTRRYERVSKSIRTPTKTAGPLEDEEGIAPWSLASTLAQVRRATKAQDAAKLICEATRGVARAGIMLKYRSGVFEGWVGSDNIHLLRQLRIPAHEPSVFRSIMESGRRYAGPHGEQNADSTFYRLVESEGGILVVEPIIVRRRLIAILCADGVRYGEVGRQRIELLGKAAAEAFERIIRQGKKTKSRTKP